MPPPVPYSLTETPDSAGLIGVLEPSGLSVHTTDISSGGLPDTPSIDSTTVTVASDVEAETRNKSPLSCQNPGFRYDELYFVLS